MMKYEGEIRELQDQGHTYHCACRILWGDGECECKLRGAVPGRVSREILNASGHTDEAEKARLQDSSIVRVPDGSVAGDDAVVGITENPFAHGCCDCGLWHSVEYALCDMEGNALSWPEGALLALRFTRDNERTGRFRESAELCGMSLTAMPKYSGAMTPEAAELSRQLCAMVTEREVVLTYFGDVSIHDLDREALLRIIALLAAGKRSQEPSRIIIPGRSQ